MGGNVEIVISPCFQLAGLADLPEMLGLGRIILYQMNQVIVG